MITRAIPSTGEALPVIGLGTWQVFDVGGGDQARQPLRAVLREFIGAGARMIDSSPMYGRAEAVTGDLVSELQIRPGVFLATKVWTSGRDQGIAQIRRSTELMRAGVLDLIQIHNLLDWRTHLATLRAMKAAGQVRYIGVTHYTTGSLPELARILDSEPGIDFVQCAYSLQTRDAETRLFPVAASRGVAVIVNRPFETGGMFRKARGRALPDWTAEFDCSSWAQLFLKYVVGEPAVTTLIPATASPEHMADDLKGGMGRLPDARQREQIRRFWDSL
ncbi:MAG: aldo/keto reductase [Alphaproteobacteria bacterium]|nr:aldo/keto reductase [Alphaproteobacteria bacterium]